MKALKTIGTIIWFAFAVVYMVIVALAFGFPKTYGKLISKWQKGLEEGIEEAEDEE